jgi:hypothetical protein
MTETHMCPVMRPEHNLREISKQLVLLEDHLFHECKRCKDCIRKHLLTAEALAEETVSLDKNQSVKGAQNIAPTIRGFQQRVSSGEDMALVGQDVRKLRKALVECSYEQGAGGPVNLRVPIFVAQKTRNGIVIVVLACVPLLLGFFSGKS